MASPRLCFTLLYSNGTFNLSRNFHLQSVGDYKWLINHYDFKSFSQSIDELIILNVDRQARNWSEFVQVVEELVSDMFMPVAIGGGIKSLEQVKEVFNFGGDKIVVNGALNGDPEFVKRVSEIYGSQSLVASLDFKMNSNQEREIFEQHGTVGTGLGISEAVVRCYQLGAGEIMLNSIDLDGTGMGFDLDACKIAKDSCSLPIIAAGGADTPERLMEGMRNSCISAVTSSHLFNFMGDGLAKTRNAMKMNGVSLAEWSYDDF